MPPGAVGVDAHGVPIYGASTDPASVDYSAVDDPAHARVWVQEGVITAQCMQWQGYDYTFTPYWLHGRGPTTYAHGTPGYLALWGENLATPYDWRDAGCYGYAVHITGNDGNH